MNNFKSLSDQIFSFKTADFESLALQIFDFQFSNNEVYRNYVVNLGLSPKNVMSIDKIPFLPIEFFKTHSVKTGSWESKSFFESSGTTGSEVSRHFYPNIDFYRENCTNCFSEFYDSPGEFVWLSLLPSYLERSNSGLVSMADHFIKSSKNKQSGFYLNEFDELVSMLGELKDSEKKVILLGVTFGLLDLAEFTQFDFPELIVMETGGMKGRKEEMVRNDVHNILKNCFGVSTIHSEYGMTELFSQAYSKNEGIFYPPRTMRVMVRDINDPLSKTEPGRIGGLNIIDLANVHSCSFIETKDLGRVYGDGSFEVLGRMDNSDVRGCNLMLA